MKKIVLLLIVIALGYYYFNSTNSENSLNVSELMNSNNRLEKVIVTGKVKSNFKIFYGIYELTDINTGEGIMVSTGKELPKIGTIITRQLKKIDVITFNDKTFSLFQEIE